MPRSTDPVRPKRRSHLPAPRSHGITLRLPRRRVAPRYGLPGACSGVHAQQRLVSAPTSLDDVVVKGNGIGNGGTLAPLPAFVQALSMSAANCVDAQPIPIGERILGLLVQVGESAAWLAEKSGVERSTVSRAVKGERHPSLETLSAFAPVLGVTLDELVTGTTAAARVKDAQSLVSRDHYDAAVQQPVD
jgi:hypothetical protein